MTDGDTTTTQPNGTAPVKTDTANANASAFDPTKVSDQDFDKIFDDPRLFKHDRFKSLADAKQELKALKEQQAKADEDKLKANKEFEKLAEAKGKEAESYRTRAETAEINSEIVRIAASKGAVDLVAVKKLIERGSIKLDDAGNVVGAEEAIEALIKSSPYLFGDGKTAPDMGRGTSPTNTNGVKRFKASQLNDAKFYRENYADIMKAFAAGAVENDLR